MNRAALVVMFIAAAASTGCTIVRPRTRFDEVEVMPVEGMTVKVHQFTGSDNPCVGGIGACTAIVGDVCFISVPAGNVCLLKHERSHCAGWSHWGNDDSCGIKLGN